MKIIDRYLLRQFVQTFVICYLSLTGLYVIFDLFTNLEEFLRCADEAGELWRLIGSYYAYRAVLFFDRTSGLLTLVAAMFTVAWIQRHNEMTALMAAGVSKLRVVRPILVAAVIIALGAAASREALIPRFREQLSRKTTDLIGDRGQEMAPCADNETGILMWGKFTYANEQRIEKPDFHLPGGLSYYGNHLIGKEAFYVPPTPDRPGGYLFHGVTSPEGLDEQASFPPGASPIIITPRDASDWLEPGQCFVVSNVNFEQLTGGLAWKQYSSTLELIRGIHNQAMDFGPDVRVTIHTRIVQPLLDMTLLLLGLPLVLKRESRNVFVAIGLCVVMVSGFMLVALGFQFLGSIYFVRPALAAWAPLMIFVPTAVAIAEPLWERSPGSPSQEPTPRAA